MNAKDAAKLAHEALPFKREPMFAEAQASKHPGCLSVTAKGSIVKI